MKRLPEGALPERPIPGDPVDPVEIATENDRAQTSLFWVIGPVVAGVVLFVIFILYLVIAARRFVMVVGGEGDRTEEGEVGMKDGDSAVWCGVVAK